MNNALEALDSKVNGKITINKSLHDQTNCETSLEILRTDAAADERVHLEHTPDIGNGIVDSSKEMNVMGSNDAVISKEFKGDAVTPKIVGLMDGKHEDLGGSKIRKQKGMEFGENEYIEANKNKSPLCSDLSTQYLLISQIFNIFASLFQHQTNFVYQICTWLVFLFLLIGKIDQDYHDDRCILLKMKHFIKLIQEVDLFHACLSWTSSWIKAIIIKIAILCQGLRGIYFQNVLNVRSDFLNFLLQTRNYYIMQYAIKQSNYFINIAVGIVKQMRNWGSGALELCLYFSLCVDVCFSEIYYFTVLVQHRCEQIFSMILNAIHWTSLLVDSIRKTEIHYVANVKLKFSHKKVCMVLFTMIGLCIAVSLSSDCLNMEKSDDFIRTRLYQHDLHVIQHTWENTTDNSIFPETSMPGGYNLKLSERGQLDMI